MKDSAMRQVRLVTTARSDWGIQRSVAAALRQRDDLRLNIVAGGMHLSREFGHTVSQINADGFAVSAELDYLVPGDQPQDIARSMAQGVSAFTANFAANRPDMLLVLGDRFDMFPAVIAATPFQIPIAHIHGGELTEGAFDDSIRHAITKMSHIHFVATQEYRQRVIQMGERSEHVHLVGAPGLDDAVSFVPSDDTNLKREYGFVAGETNVLITYHPETRSKTKPASDMRELLDAVASINTETSNTKTVNIVIVQPNADTGNQGIVDAIRSFCDVYPRVRMPASIPRADFLSLMRAASVMVGNSSSGIIDAPTFQTPVVNVGDRQKGRVRARNVIDTQPMSRAIEQAIDLALSVEFAKSLKGLQNPYGNGGSAQRIAEIVATTTIDRELLAKSFVDQQFIDQQFADRTPHTTVDQAFSAPHNLASSTNIRTADSISSRQAHSIGE